ncbi:DUF1566 domain-containing protein [Burkholderia sp. BCCIQ04A]|uniref:DUF1566 domain-containing protein n=1 Tax=Burkholderia anthinoferrum TaxID=3090833 RepID=A0ABU5WNR3_9BURK|nr:DUF1566 domain-containing protein [Burkholderia anthinoferrum]MEB2504602.1 DUF1566 domain-containing protein [Burkholderia anthinoferrum]MEB2530271.1 DUF1566 domain-containing protein [Burkholderia anthinoferrum]MEB2561644.1 DUF1566 domain-containing protein [Burkholderia anthinoferrum]MEB2580606.1 DUF1566 domain-containing protein [Burkholderia anthinoferrum]MEB2634416.1 DUF1566 domain-containing protein [Burkholderia anthinoferrum]
MTPTLEAIEAEHARIGAMIEELKKQPRATEYRVDAVTIPLAAGERCAGPILNEGGTLSHYLIVLPGEAESVTWDQACEWAEQQGGELPSRREQSLLFTNLRGEFESAWYWSGEEAEESGWAWCQLFGSGYQVIYLQYGKLRARAVRRFIPSVI